MITRGAPIVVVSGLPRSGTSMIMGMLHAGGLPLLTDGIRNADDSNPRGYFEYERVKELDKNADRSWLEEARGKGIKIISFLLRHLPDTNDYRVIFMHRKLDEVIASQDAMLRARGEPLSPTRVDLASAYHRHIADVMSWLEKQPRFTVLSLDHRDVVTRPQEAAEKMAAFLEAPLDIGGMTAAVDRTLHRNRT